MTHFSPYDPSAGKTYPAVEPTKIARIEIFPPVGIARVGDSGVESELEYYYGPEVPGIDDHPFGDFRDKKGLIKRQAARFRVYAYDAADNVLGEINNSQNYQLHWTVHVANKKASYYLFSGQHRPRKTELRNPDIDPVSKELSGDPFDTSLETRTKLIVDPGAQSIVRDVKTGNVQNVSLVGQFQGSLPEADKVSVSLGELRTDDQGRLVFLGGTGKARSVRYSLNRQPEIISEFDSVDWIDDVCDGWVDVEVTHADRPAMAAEVTKPRKATVLSAPPKFAWGIDSPTSLYDILENIYKNKTNYLEHMGTEFYKDIWPVLSGTYKLSWVNNKAYQGHGLGAFGNFLPKENELSSPSPDTTVTELRQHIFSRLREPDFRNPTQAHTIFMPRLSGDNGDAIEPGGDRNVIGEPIQRFAALTELQFKRFQDFRDGNYKAGDAFSKQAIEEYSAAEQPVMLARAMLEQTIGDPLYPGIEVFWIAKLEQVYVTTGLPKNMVPPFRVDHNVVLPGFLSRGLSLPWQSDFDLCNTHWWPSARPDDVVSANIGVASDPPVTLNSMGERKKWAEGLRDTPEDMSVSFFPGSTDMIRSWNELGFVRKIAVSGTPYPIWVERDRVMGRGFVPGSFSD
ncbi:hypothetical protein K438DRAFT_1813258 [Mycena galopus ATCC 62051]|nr:hypothetical protein K438DRAFT_1813258 [Mycena galopus ATCC 62051]